MFEVLVFVYENYWRGDDCPEPHQLGRKLAAAGFDDTEISSALVWLAELNLATHGGPNTPEQEAPAISSAPWHSSSLRIYSPLEQTHLGEQCLSFLHFLESAGELPPHLREVVIDRAMATHEGPLHLDQLKIIVLMVYWSVDREPSALVLHELCDDATERVKH